MNHPANHGKSNGDVVVETPSSPSSASERFGGLTSVISDSIRSLTQGAFIAIAGYHRSNNNYLKSFEISNEDLSNLSNDRSREAFIKVLQNYVDKVDGVSEEDEEAGVIDNDALHSKEATKSKRFIKTIIEKLKQDELITNPTQVDKEKMNRNKELAAMALTTIILRSSPDVGISSDGNELQHRIESFGANSIAAKKLKSFITLMWEAVQDFVLIMLIVMGVITISVETTIGLDEGESCGSCWLEGFAILTSVCIVVLITAGIDYGKQLAFQDLSKKLDTKNKKSVIRNGEQVLVTDAEIVVGDILSVNSHSLASISADCVLLGPNTDLRMNESSLTGESHAVKKIPGDVILSGTNAVEGAGKMVVIAVGVYSVAGKIKARVYESADYNDDLEGDEETPLFKKLDKIAKQIGLAGSGAALFALAISSIIGFGIQKQDWKMIIDYLVLSITVLAVAVPEGLPLAVTLSLAFSSSKMATENNMVKTLSACETMGCATTICTDKTGKKALYLFNT